MDDLMNVAEAREKILAHFQPLPAEWVDLNQATGRVLAQAITAPFDLPRFANSSLDGFAIISADLQQASSDHPITLEVIEDIPAGAAPSLRVSSGKASRIMTGAVLPAGADAVVPVEDTDQFKVQTAGQFPGKVTVHQSAPSGHGVRTVGSDAHQGDVLLKSGMRVKPAALALCASLGLSRVQVSKKPTVAILSTGNELISTSESLTPGKIYESNSQSLAAALKEDGAEILELGIAKDEPDDIRRLFEQAVNAGVDFILTSAGVSVGVYDYVRDVINAQGQLEFWRVNMRPGKPLAFGQYRGVPVIGLPGNPVSALVGYYVFVKPVIHHLAGVNQKQILVISVKLLDNLDTDGRESYLRVNLEWDGKQWLAHQTSHQGSGNLSGFSTSNALLIVPSGVKSMTAGSLATAWLFDKDL
jgi:molybdopterin molybdotransferase